MDPDNDHRAVSTYFGPSCGCPDCRSLAAWGPQQAPDLLETPILWSHLPSIARQSRAGCPSAKAAMLNNHYARHYKAGWTLLMMSELCVHEGCLFLGAWRRGASNLPPLLGGGGASVAPAGYGIPRASLCCEKGHFGQYGQVCLCHASLGQEFEGALRLHWDDQHSD